ncbi:MAG TPA: OmpA family protein [Myxococcales bacterium]
MRAVFLAFFSLAAPAFAVQKAAQGDAVQNIATVSAAGFDTVISAPATIKVRIPSPPKIELLVYAPRSPAETPEQVAGGAFAAGAADAALKPLPIPLPIAGGPLDLSAPLPLVGTRLYHQGDPIFIRVTELDENMDRTARESVLVTVSADLTGDTEVVRLIEDGPDTGVFVGYLPTRRSAPNVATRFDGALQLFEKATITARYTDASDTTSTVSAAAGVDPFGLVFDSKSGKPVSGAQVTVIDVATGQPAAVLSDDGLSNFPSTVTSGQQAVDAGGRVYPFAPGEFRFPVLQTGSYRFEVKPPAGYSAPSKATDAQIAALGSFTVVNPGSRGEAFRVDAGPAIHIDVPVDPAGASLWVTKTASKDSAGIGDFLAYQIAVMDADKLNTAADVHAIDFLPPGFRYKKGSAQVDGARIQDPQISPDGRTLDFAIGTLAPLATSTVTFVVQIGAGAAKGQLAINLASATDAGKGASNTAQAVVKVTDDFFSARSFLMGRVTTGTCDAKDGEGQIGVEGVRILLEDGTFAGTDKDGRYHFEGLNPGTHVVQLDPESLPEGYEAVSCVRNDRFAGRAASQFVDLAGGSLWRADFHLQRRLVAKAAAAPPAPVVPEPGELGISLSHTAKDLSADFAVAMRGARAPVSQARLLVALPNALHLLPGTSQLDGVTVGEPVAQGELVVYELGSLPSDWRKVLTFRAVIDDGAPARDLSVSATLEAGDGVVKVSSKSAANALKIGRESTTKPVSLVIHPHFASFGTELSAPDKKQLELLAARLSKTKPNHIVVTGHTDSVQIRKGSQRVFKDNTALSLGRAESVANYLAKFLRLPPDRIISEGKGDQEPIASNKTFVGRAINRRVEVSAIAEDAQEKTVLVSLTLASGEQRTPVAPAAVSASLAVAVNNASAAAAPAANPSGAQPAVFSAGTATVSGGTATVSAGTATVAATTTPSTGTDATTITSTGTSTSTSTSTSTGTSISTSTVAADAATIDPAANTLAAGGPIPAHSQAPSTSLMPPNDGLALTPPALQKPPPPAPDGILAPADGELIADRVGAVQIRAMSYLTLKLTLDGKEVDSSRIGFKAEDRTASKTTYTFVGVDFGDKGSHELVLTGKDPFGNVRLEKTARVLRTGAIASIRFVGADGNVADGRTPVRARVELLDARGDVIRGATRLELREGNLSPLRFKADKVTLDDAVSRQIPMDKDGYVNFAPVTTSGSYRAVLACGGSTVEVELWAKPKMRDWVLVGLAEGTAGYSAITGNAQTLTDDGVDQNLYADGRVAFYAKGQIKGQWLVTAAYDSARAPNPNASLFNQIDPNTYFTLYGDGSQQGYDAASSRKVYVKIEREQMYALFGDFDTGLTVTELSRYTRRLNGFKGELATRYVEANAFGAETSQSYARDEIPGDGTSGLYRLSRRGITLNSEIVTILVRDRFRSEVVVSSTVLTRFTDYSIDYDAGTLFFRQPISSRDDNLNPITIVVEYESSLFGQKDLTAGGRAGVKLFDNRLKAGVSYIHEGQGNRQNDLAGADAKLQIDQNTRLRAEYAVSDSRDTGVDAAVGQAWLAELARTTKQLDAKLYFREEQGAFGLGQQAFSEAGTRKFGLETAYRIDEHYSLSGQAFRQDTFSTSAERLFGEARFGYAAAGYSAYAGLLDASDKLLDGSTHTSSQVTAGGKVALLSEKLILGIDYAQSVFGNGSVDFPTRIDGRAEYKVTKGFSLIGDEEVTFGDTAITNTARLGFRSSLWQGGTLTSTVDRSLDENEARVFRNIGLRQTLQLSDAWKMDAGAERTLTVRRTGFYAVSPLFAPASGTTNGEDFTALSIGANYQVKKLAWDSRAELRTARDDDKWSLTSGVVAERSDGWAWSGRGQYLGSSTFGQHTTASDLRFGLVYRPVHTHWIFLNRLDWLLQRADAGIAAANASVPGATGTSTGGAAPAPGLGAVLATASLGIDSWRLVDNFVGNFRPTKDLQLSFGVGLKYGREVVQDVKYEGVTDQPSIEARYDLNETWDVGVRGSILHVWGLHQVAYSAGPSVGMSPVTNLWISAGFNVVGYYDQDFSASNATAFGPYLRMRFKFDQDSIKEAAAWINKQ